MEALVEFRPGPPYFLDFNDSQFYRDKASRNVSWVRLRGFCDRFYRVQAALEKRDFENPSSPNSPRVRNIVLPISLFS